MMMHHQNGHHQHQPSTTTTNELESISATFNNESCISSLSTTVTDDHQADDDNMSGGDNNNKMIADINLDPGSPPPPPKEPPIDGCKVDGVVVDSDSQTGGVITAASTPSTCTVMPANNNNSQSAGNNNNNQPTLRVVMHSEHSGAGNGGSGMTRNVSCSSNLSSGNSSSVIEEKPPPPPPPIVPPYTVDYSIRPTDLRFNESSSVIIQKQLDRIESLETQLERVKLERDSLLAENERLCFELQMLTLKQQRQTDIIKGESNTASSTQGICSCAVSSSMVSSPGVESQTHCNCGTCMTIAAQDKNSTLSVTAAGTLEHQTKPNNSDLVLSQSDPSLLTGQRLPYSGSNDTTNRIANNSFALKSTFPSFKGEKLGAENSAASVGLGSSQVVIQPHHQLHHHHQHHQQQHHLHHHHSHLASQSYLFDHDDHQRRHSEAQISQCQHCKPTISTPPTDSCNEICSSQRTSAAAVMYGGDSFHQLASPSTPTTLSPTFSKALSTSINLSPSSATSPLFPSSHALNSNLTRSARATGGSSTSLASTNTGVNYQGYELSQQLLDKQVTALERKYGGQKAREAAIKIQRAYRSYRLQKRFTTLAIQAICHQQLKQQIEQQQLLQQQQQQQQQQKARKETEAMNRAVVAREMDTLQVETMAPAPVDRAAIHGRFSRKLSANFALSDLRLQSTQQMTASNNMSTAHQQHQHHQQQQHQQHQQYQHQTYLSIPRQTSPAMTLVSNYEPVYNANLSHMCHMNQSPQQELQKKNSLSSASSTGSSSSLHASSGSSKPSELTLGSGGSSRAMTKDQQHHQHHPHETPLQRVPSQLYPSQVSSSHKHSQRISKQQSQSQFVPNNSTMPHTGNNSATTLLKPGHQQQASSSSSTQLTANSVSFAPNLEFTGNIQTSEMPVSTITADAYRKRQYRVGLNLFNKAPSERGIKFLISKGFIEQSDVMETQASHVANFLLTRKGLSRQMIGEYIAENLPFNQAVLKSFCGGVNLSGIIVDEALRAFQVHFRFPGEAQKIERLVEAFADRYKECNPSDVLSRDSIFILAFAIIMLNTDLHKPTNYKHRMTPDQWLTNLKGVFSEGDLSAQFLLGIYKRIKKQELQTGGDHVTQVLKVQSTIIGKDVPNLGLPHRRLVCYCRLYEIRDLNRREKPGQHQRDVFLFNDLLLITKTTSRSRNGQLAEYQYRSSCPLDGLQVIVFSTPYYPNGIRISRRMDNKIIACFNARNDLDQQRFVDDLQEAINEMDDMEQLRITKSSSLVHLNKLTSMSEQQAAAILHQVQSSTVIASPTELGTSFSSSLSFGTNPLTSSVGNNNNNNGCAGQSMCAADRGEPAKLRF